MRVHLVTLVASFVLAVCVATWGAPAIVLAFL
jgi:hypothetical protein